MASKSKRLTKEQKLRRERWLTVGKWALLLGGTYEAYMILVHRRQARRDAFNAALNAKSATNKPLAVIGDPQGSFVSRVLGQDFDCADVCIDPKGCPTCPNAVVQDSLEALESMPANSHVVFVDSGVFEKTKYPSRFMLELQRVSGGDYFMSHRERWALGAFSPFMQRRVFTAPPATPFIEWRDLPWAPGPSKVERLSAHV